MSKSRREVVADYCKKIRSGEVAFSDLHSILGKDGHSDEDIEIIIPRIDRDLQRIAANELERTKGKQMVFGGIGLMILGISITITSYLGIIDLGDRFVISYGPMLGGLGLALVGKMKMN